jgi:ABC-type branched-subunit amino acid transport system substrate-binding protein
MIRLLSLIIVSFWWLGFLVSEAVPESTDPPSFKVGVSLPLTGDLAEYGAAVRNGIQLARSKFPNEFQRLSLDFEDNRYDAKTALAILSKFEGQKVDLVYSWGEVPFNAIAPVAEARQLALTAYSLDNSSARNSRFIVLTSNHPRSLTAPLMRALRDSGAKRIGIVKMEDPYINASITGLTANLLPGEELKIISTVLPGGMDTKPHALRVKSSSVDVLGVYLYPGQISSFYRNLSQLRVLIPTFGTDIFESRAEIRSAGQAMHGALYPNFEIPEWFEDEYRQRFKNDAQISYAYNGYAWAIITAHVFKSVSGKISSEDLIGRFKTVSSAEVGINFIPNKLPEGVFCYEFPAIVRRVVDGEFETAKGAGMAD